MISGVESLKRTVAFKSRTGKRRIAPQFIDDGGVGAENISLFGFLFCLTLHPFQKRESLFPFLHKLRKYNYS